MNDDLRRKRLHYRSWHRGTKELDLLLGGFADRHLAEFSPAQLDRFEALLQNSDPDIYLWISGREPIPEAHDDDIMALLRNFKIKI